MNKPINPSEQTHTQISITILGCGWLGLPLANSFVQDGHLVQGSTTSLSGNEKLASKGIRPYIFLLEREVLNISLGLFQCDLLIVAIPPSKVKSSDDYLKGMQRVIDNAVERGVSRVIFISSTSVYGECNRIVDEDYLPEGKEERSALLIEAERMFRESTDLRCTIVRFGGLIGPGRNPANFLADKTIVTNGLAPVNMIGLDDCVGIIKQIIAQDFFGSTINACCPHHPTRADFYTHFMIQSSRQIPEFQQEMTAWKTVQSKYIPALLQYDFIVKRWF